MTFSVLQTAFFLLCSENEHYENSLFVNALTNQSKSIRKTDPGIAFKYKLMWEITNSHRFKYSYSFISHNGLKCTYIDICFSFQGLLSSQNQANSPSGTVV